MGYACPVCDVEQADARHLANHLAVTASLGRRDHLEWLEERAPNWAECGPDELGEIVAEYAPETDAPTFEGEDHAHGHEPGRPGGFEDGLARQTRGSGRGELTGEAAGVLEEARELTRRMHDDESDGRNENASRNENA
ncbi:DUF5810 domain-containing protein [Natrarchaeobius chitinivorans]|uniref:Uncharacterized protein n=1 Tax=Natrarchaeobius chitinivorans TaxID=1679083 RepID=A0A3N6P6M3_NATCH|nr:DUF5810 domain-containing protein [Natrarchaeobius chitinivorans]RQG94029.1 hypothetical protein EA473_13215 [Natrarchaeobius chitinivorans]